MAVNDNSVLIIDTGNYFTAPVNTALPVDLAAPEVAWEAVGHTSLEDIFSTSSEGGDSTVIGTLQKKTLRTTYSPRTESLHFTLQQFDEAGLKLYYGSNMVTNPDGTLGVPVSPTPTVCAFLAIFVDRDNRFAFYAPKAEIFRAEDPEFSDTESLAGLPLSVKPIQSGSNAWAYAVTPLESL